MHGTFRSQVAHDAASTVCFGAPVLDPHRREWRSTVAALLTGCCMAAFPTSVAKAPAFQFSAPKHTPPSRSAAPPRLVYNPTLLAKRVIIRQRQPQTIRIDLPPPTPTPTTIPVVDISPPAPAQIIAEAPTTSTARPVDIAQISDSDVRSLNIPDLHEPGLMPGGEGLSAKIADMQVTPLPPVRLRDGDRAALLAEAPTQMTVRIGTAALGKVDFHMTDTWAIDVRLGDLLDLLADRYDAADFARLRNSAAADAYVSFDQLRALGLNVRYDAAYDELRINS